MNQACFVPLSVCRARTITWPAPVSARGRRVSRTFKPDLAILDIQMPEMDGFQLMEELQVLDPELDVIFMTGSVHEIDAKLVKAIRKEAFYFLQKPFDEACS